jgi:hypothetical protein
MLYGYTTGDPFALPRQAPGRGSPPRTREKPISEPDSRSLGYEDAYDGAAPCSISV